MACSSSFRMGKTKYMASYTAKDLDLAVKMVDNGSLSIRAAAKHYNVPRSTLADRFNGRVEIGVKPGRKSALAPKIEDQIVKQSLEAAEAGFGISRRQLCQKTGHVVKRLQIKTPFKYVLNVVHSLLQPIN